LKLTTVVGTIGNWTGTPDNPTSCGWSVTFFLFSKL